MDQCIRTLFEYNGWANRRVAASLRTMAGTVDRPLKLFSHALNAERLWLSRFAGGAGPMPWDDHTLDECDRLVEENHAAYAKFLDTAEARDDRSMFAYRNTEGVASQTSLRDIFLQVLTHGCYHRGQIATAVKEGGGTPAQTDFIHYTREIGS